MTLAPKLDDSALNCGQTLEAQLLGFAENYHASLDHPRLPAPLDFTTLLEVNMSTLEFKCLVGAVHLMKKLASEQAACRFKALSTILYCPCYIAHAAFIEAATLALPSPFHVFPSVP